MRVFLNQRIEKQEKQLMSLKEWQKRAEVAEEITTGVQTELRNRIADYDELVKKNGIAEKELAKVKRSTKGVNVNKEMMDSLKKGKNLLLKKVEVEKEKNRLTKLDIEEERKIRAQYMVQLEEERSARRAAESDMRDYQKRAESSKGRMIALKSKIEVREEELTELRSHYFEMEEEMSKAKQERQDFAVQINSKIAELDIEKEELQRIRDKLTRSEDMVRVLERSNEALGASNEAIIEDNTEVTCEYHAGHAGHSIEACFAFKRKVLQLIKVGWVTFDDPPNKN
ncbi:uncharacterized protein [Populus alba]|uniref:uncharacterized protein n=1 Tax=Populus alba TaxID=43335 RepID=UPI00158E2687|nr:CTTNBP2 N-terminal-like protein [Populus alba]